MRRPGAHARLLKSIREQIGKGPGDTVSVELWKDEAERTADVPPELAKVLKKERLTEIFGALSYTHRKEYCRWITVAKKEETRARRLAQSVEMLRAGIKTPG
ncbi:MAG: YdeI/OmpD-associated family protein [Acidobacteriaceae bacterium]